MNIQSMLQVTPKDTFYNSKEEVVTKSKTMHNELIERDRELYTYLLYFDNSTYFSKSSIITNLLSKSLYNEDEKIRENLLVYEDALIHHALFNENATHAIKMLLQLKESRINNSRTTKIILDYIFNRGNTDFLCIKYRNKIKQLLIHALGLATINKILSDTKEGKKLFDKYIAKYNNPYAKEIFNFVCGKASDLSEDACKSIYIKDYLKAERIFKNDYFNFKELKGSSLPVEVLIGFNNYYKKHLDISTLINLGKVSDKQKIQLQNAVKKASNNTVEIKIDFSKYAIIDLYKYLYNKNDLDEAEKNTILNEITSKAKEIADNNPDFNPANSNAKPAIILDLSNSNEGSVENPYAPLYKNLLLHKVLTSYTDVKTYNVGGKLDEERSIYIPQGETDIAKSLVSAVIDGYSKIIILSDGFDNIGNVDSTYSKLKELYPNLSVIHYNPVFSPKDFSCKMLSEDFITLPFVNEKDISNMTLFSILAESETDFKVALKAKIDKEVLNKED